MAKQTVFDIVVAGGGASGLLLLIEMARNGVFNGKSIGLIERESEKLNDRTWCFWSSKELPNYISNSVSYSWPECMNDGIISALQPYKYYHIRSKDFYDNIHKELEQYSELVIINDTINQVLEKTNCVELILKDYSIYTKILFNSIAEIQDLKLPKNSLWQFFHGWRVQFDDFPNKNLHLKLMDFNIEQNDSTQFVYVLPFSDNSALFELTRFGLTPLNKKEINEILKNYLEQFSKNYSIVEEEINQIPMDQFFDATSKYYLSNQKIISIGTAAGALKPTAGYGFLSMHKHSVSIVNALNNKELLPKIYRKKRFRLYDAILLRILKNEPIYGKPIFKSLFNKVQTPLILKFLDEETSIIEDIKIFQQLPVFYFIKQLIYWIIDQKIPKNKKTTIFPN